MTESGLATTVLRTNLADSPITRALKDGRVTSDLVRLDFCGPRVAFEGFRPMVREGAFDAGELALATFLQAKSHGKPFSLLPAVMSGRFQHASISYNADFGELRPRDLEGRRVGVRSYTQTTGLWVRGILAHDYGVDPDKVTWVCTEGAHLAEYPDPPNVERVPEGGKTLQQMLLDGDVDALVMGVESLPRSPAIRPLIPDPQTAAQAWLARHNAVPINHLFVVDTALIRRRPEVVREVYRMLSESKRLAASGTIDTMPFGFKANRRSIEIAVELALEQGIIPRRLSVDELYADALAALGG
jgi:4,5-dihydroxyphthalate decarboxylase